MHRRLLYPATPTHAARRCRLDPADPSGLPAGVVQRKKRSASGGDQVTPRASSRTDESPGSRLSAETHADSFLRPQPLAFRKNQPAVDPPPPRFWRIFLAVVIGQKSSRFGAGWTDSCAASCTNRATLGSKRPRNRSQSRPNTTGTHIRQVSVGRGHRPGPPAGPTERTVGRPRPNRRRGKCARPRHPRQRGLAGLALVLEQRGRVGGPTDESVAAKNGREPPGTHPIWPASMTPRPPEMFRRCGVISGRPWGCGRKGRR